MNSHAESTIPAKKNWKLFLGVAIALILFSSIVPSLWEAVSNQRPNTIAYSSEDFRALIKSKLETETGLQGYYVTDGLVKDFQDRYSYEDIQNGSFSLSVDRAKVRFSTEGKKGVVFRIL